MTLSKRLAVATVFVLTSAVTTFGQIKLPAETKNAALRYWMAFAELHDTGADKSIADLLGKTMSGEGAWDETKLGPIVDVNMESIGIMQRAAKLPECDWGREYSPGTSHSDSLFANVSARTGKVEHTLRYAACNKGRHSEGRGYVACWNPVFTASG